MLSSSGTASVGGEVREAELANASLRLSSLRPDLQPHSCGRLVRPALDHCPVAPAEPPVRPSREWKEKKELGLGARFLGAP